VLRSFHQRINRMLDGVRTLRVLPDRRRSPSAKRMLHVNLLYWSSDEEAIQDDWEAVGKDLQMALWSFWREHESDLGEDRSPEKFGVAWIELPPRRRPGSATTTVRQAGRGAREMSGDLSREQDGRDDTDESQAPFLSIRETSFSGPLPPPQVLKDYNDVLPDAAERIIAMAETQSVHRQSLERLSVEATLQDARAGRAERRTGQWLGFTLALVAIVGGSLAAILSPGTAGQIGGAVIGGSALVSLVSVFVAGSESTRSRSRSEQQDE